MNIKVMKYKKNRMKIAKDHKNDKVNEKMKILMLKRKIAKLARGVLRGNSMLQRRF